MPLIINIIDNNIISLLMTFEKSLEEIYTIINDRISKV